MAHSPIAIQVRATMFVHLAAMEKAGLPADKSFAHLQLPAAFQPRVVATRKLITRGKDIATAGFTSGLFSEIEYQLLRAATDAGSPALTYQRLAQRYEQKARAASQIKSRLALPTLMLLAALLIQPLPALVAGSITGSAYLWGVIRPFLALAGLFFVGRFSWKRLQNQTDKPTSIQISLTKLLASLPVIGTLLVQANVRDFYENLALLLEAGVPMLDALPKATKTVSLCTIRTDFAQLLPHVTRGAPLSQAVVNLHYKTKNPAHPYIQTGEASGTLPEMLLRFADGESETVAQRQAMLAEWLPRLVYGAVAAWMAYQILQPHIL